MKNRFKPQASRLTCNDSLISCSAELTKEVWSHLPEWQRVMNSILNGKKEACKSRKSNTLQIDEQGVVHD